MFEGFRPNRATDIVDEHINAAKSLRSGVHRGFRAVPCLQICRHINGFGSLCAQVCGDFLTDGRTVNHRNARALCGSTLGDAAANALRCACDRKCAA
jgi:hypothetical protein